MDDLLKPTSSRLLTPEEHIDTAPAKTEIDVAPAPQNVEDILKALRSSPDLDLLAQILGWLSTPEIVDIKLPGPKSTLIIAVLVNEIIPNYWDVLQENNGLSYFRVQKLLLRSLTSVAGIGAFVSRLRHLINVQRNSTAQSGVQKTSEDQSIRTVLEVLEAILQGISTMSKLWEDIQSSKSTQTQRILLWKELISIVAAGRLLSISAQASMVLNENSPSIDEGSWVGNGRMFSAWLGKNINYMISQAKTALSMQKTRDAALLISRSLTLGYNGWKLLLSSVRRNADLLQTKLSVRCFLNHCSKSIRVPKCINLYLVA